MCKEAPAEYTTVLYHRLFQAWRSGRQSPPSQTESPKALTTDALMSESVVLRALPGIYLWEGEPPTLLQS